MATLQGRINQISPYNSTNTTGSTKVLATPERQGKPANMPDREWYAVVWTDDGGDTYQKAIIELVGVNIGTDQEAWNFVNWPACVDDRRRTFKNNLEDQVKAWWQATGKNIYQTRSDSTIYDLDLNLGMVRCTFITSDSPPKIRLDKIFFLKKGSTWMIGEGSNFPVV